eukprot:CAMPEP_0114396978 /NCGR_PEP_ID=MMETSP0102-20121206/13930_1 /TAXON_ID=38822 ORGANISM="Pteridomonas danica, Strain PT" /NCGR_SAMPLE_ID=MMETSP0102 /ASSEMBLY_ACC=CAM_ASM_000212 /LENGTH=503 /DNA_ID=CAMNT_0001557881 /DNA_START=249 /DNA_END=1758 /DNA_ORIENTATION=-
MLNAKFIDNDAVQYGGGFYIAGGANTLDDVVLTNNDAQLGGTEYYFNGGSLSATDFFITSLTEDSIAGSSSASAVCESPCSAGEYGNCSSISNAPNCYVNCECADCFIGTASSVVGSTLHSDIECTNCSMGTSSSIVGSTLPSDCVKCTSGSYASVVASTSCEACPIGKFATDNETDYGGGLVTQVISGAITCNDCPAGYIAEISSLFVCIACDAGKASKAGKGNCSSCPIGTYSESGQSQCTNCVSGKYNYIVGAQLCVGCDTSKTSSPGSFECDQAEAGYFLLDNEVQDCPDGTDCLGGYLTPIPQAGYWMDRSNINYADHAYKCSRGTCTGSQNSSCWTVGSIENNTCNNDKLLCKKGAHGPLCGSCQSGYTYSSDELVCISCSSESMIGAIVLLAIGLFFLILAFLHWKIPILVWDSYILMVIRNLFKSGSLKVLISAYQIIQSITSSMEVIYPKVFAVSLTWLNFLALDMPGLECSGVGVYGRVYFASLVPIIMALVV